MTLTDTELAGIRLVLEDDPGYHSLSNRAVLRLVEELEAARRAAGRAAAKFVFQSEPDRYAAEHPEQRDDDTPPTATRYCLGEPMTVCGKCSNPIVPPSVRCSRIIGTDPVVGVARCEGLPNDRRCCRICGNLIPPAHDSCQRILGEDVEEAAGELEVLPDGDDVVGEPLSVEDAAARTRAERSARLGGVRLPRGKP